MPFNVVQGDTIEFTVEFLDLSQNLVVPPSGTLNIVYTTVAGSTALDSIVLTQAGSFFTASWNSGVSKLGFANWSVSAPGSPFSPAKSGQLRIIDP